MGCNPRALPLEPSDVTRRRRCVRERCGRFPSEAVPGARARRAHLRLAPSRSAREGGGGHRPVSGSFPPPSYLGGKAPESLPPDSVDDEDETLGRGARRMLAVGGGRGGVGKSLVAQNL